MAEEFDNEAAAVAFIARGGAIGGTIGLTLGTVLPVVGHLRKRGDPLAARSIGKTLASVMIFTTVGGLSGWLGGAAIGTTVVVNRGIVKGGSLAYFSKPSSLKAFGHQERSRRPPYKYAHEAESDLVQANQGIGRKTDGAAGGFLELMAKARPFSGLGGGGSSGTKLPGVGVEVIF